MDDLGFGYSSSVDWTQFTEAELDLIAKLPHGSGIDYDWHGEKLGNGKVRASNAYHAMDDAGFYRQSFDFSITFRADSPSEFRLMFHGCNPEKVSYGYGLRDYLEDTIADCLIAIDSPIMARHW